MPDSFASQHKFMRALLVACMVSIVLVASPLSGLATGQIEAPLDATPAVVASEPFAETEGEDIEIAAEAGQPSAPLTPAATEAPTVTPVPTPTPVSPTPTPVQPTQAPTEVPADVTPTEGPAEVTPTPTAAPAMPTPAPTPSEDFSVQRIVSGSGCTQVSSTDIVPVGTAVEFHCNAVTSPGNSRTWRTFTRLTAGWEYQVNDGAWLSAVEAPVSQAGGIPSFTLRLRPTGVVTPGSQGFITVEVSTNSGSNPYITTLGATLQGVTAPTAADLQLMCEPVSVSTKVNAAQLVKCSYSGKSTLGTRQITLTQITVPAPAGWSITSPAGSVAGRTLTVAPNAVITYGAQAYTFTYSLTPGCTAPTTAQPINLTSIFTFNTTTGIAGPTFSQSATRLDTSSLAVSVLSNSLVWNEPYSLQESSVRGNLTYQVVANGCSGWNIQVSASPYQYTGPNNGTSIPASNLSLTATGSPLVISGASTGVSRQTVTGPMDTQLKVMNATPGSGNGTYQQQLELNLTIPGRSMVGTYQSTITVTSAAAP